jgi:hypothetical protein
LLRKTRQIAVCFDLLPSTFPLKLDPEQNAAVNKDDRLSSLYYYYRFFLAFQFFFPGQKVTRKQQKYDFFVWSWTKNSESFILLMFGMEFILWEFMNSSFSSVI